MSPGCLPNMTNRKYRPKPKKSIATFTACTQQFLRHTLTAMLWRDGAHLAGERNENVNQRLHFECSSTTYLDCVEKNLFGSNKPWPFEIKSGDYCLLHHYEIGRLPGLLQASCDGGKGLVPQNLGRKVSLSGQSQTRPPQSH
jgi:hypothetical protein